MICNGDYTCGLRPLVLNYSDVYRNDRNKPLTYWVFIICLRMRVLVISCIHVFVLTRITQPNSFHEIFHLYILQEYLITLTYFST